MSYNIGKIRPHHPDAFRDHEHELTLTSFVGPEPDKNWLQLSIGAEFIRLSPPQIMALLVLCEQRLKREDSEMIEL